MTPAESGSLLASKEHARIFRRSKTAKTRFASAHIYTARNLIEPLLNKIKQCRPGLHQLASISHLAACW
jgi:hypothetical protein